MAAAAANAGQWWCLKIVPRPIPKCHYWPALATDAEATTDAQCVYTLKVPKRHAQILTWPIWQDLLFWGSDSGLHPKSWNTSIKDPQLTEKKDNLRDFSNKMEGNYIFKVNIIDINNFKFCKNRHLQTCQTSPEAWFEFTWVYCA